MKKTIKPDWTQLQKDVPALPTKEEWDQVAKHHKTSDNINPNHYKMQNKMECIDIMIEIFGRPSVNKWAEINAFKYCFRMHNKGARIDNIKKAIWNLEFALGKDPRDKDNA
tara:strand:+ start:296 stop:628 length:333 start_codon:yes stop_codon:yes gene_type:complete